MKLWSKQIFSNYNENIYICYDIIIYTFNNYIDMSTSINKDGFQHSSNVLKIPDIINLSQLDPHIEGIISIQGTKSLRIPQHPGPDNIIENTGENGQMRFNSITNKFEFYQNGSWSAFSYNSVMNNTNNTYVSDDNTTPSHTFLFKGYQNTHSDHSNLSDLYSDASFQLFGGAQLYSDTNGIILDGANDWTALPKSVTNFGVNDFTISWWMSIDDLTDSVEYLLNMSYNNSGMLFQTNDGTNTMQLSHRYAANVINTNANSGSIDHTIVGDSLYNYVLTRQGAMIKIHRNKILILEYTISDNNYSFPDMYSNYGIAGFNTNSDNFFSFGYPSPAPSVVGPYTKTSIYRVDIWNHAITTSDQIYNIYHQGYIYPFHSPMKFVVNNNCGLYIKPTDYTIQYINYNKGYVGIGKTDPGCMLDVSGTVGIDGALIINNPDTNVVCKMHYNSGSGLNLDSCGNDYFSSTTVGTSSVQFKTGTTSIFVYDKLQTTSDNRVGINRSEETFPTIGNTLSVNSNVIVGKTFVDANSVAPASSLIIENALEINNQDYKQYLGDAVSAYFFEVDGAMGSVEDIVRGSGHAICDISSDLYNPTLLTNYGLYKQVALGSWVSVPDIQIPSNGQFSITLRFFPTNSTSGQYTYQTIYNAGISSITNHSEQFGTIRIYNSSPATNIRITVQGVGPNLITYEYPGAIQFRAWNLIVVNFVPNQAPTLSNNGISFTGTQTFPTTSTDTVDGFLYDHPGNYGGKMLTPMKALDRVATSERVNTTDIDTLRPFSYTFGNGSNAVGVNHFKGYISTYMVFGRILTLSDAIFWTNALNGYDYCIAGLIVDTRNHIFNVNNKVYIKDSEVRVENAEFDQYAITRGDVATEKLSAGTVTVEHGTVNVDNLMKHKLISAYYFEKIGGGQGSINDEIRDLGSNGEFIGKDIGGATYVSATHLTDTGIKMGPFDSDTNDVMTTAAYIQIPNMPLPKHGIFTISFRYKIMNDPLVNDSALTGIDQRIYHASFEGKTSSYEAIMVCRNKIRIWNFGTSATVTYTLNDGYNDLDKWYHLVIGFKPDTLEPVVYLNNEQKTLTHTNTDTTIFNHSIGAVLTPYTKTGTPDMTCTFGGNVYSTVGFDDPAKSFQGFISTYQVFNGSLTREDVNYWYNKLNNTNENQYVENRANNKGLISAYYFQKYGGQGSTEDEIRGPGYGLNDSYNNPYDASGIYIGEYGINHGLESTDIFLSYSAVPEIKIPDNGVITIQMRYHITLDDANSDYNYNGFWRANVSNKSTQAGHYANGGTISLRREYAYNRWNLFIADANPDPGDGNGDFITVDYAGYEKDQWNTFTLIIKPYATPILYLNGNLMQFTTGTRNSIVNSHWGGQTLGPVIGTPSGYTQQYVTFGYAPTTTNSFYNDENHNFRGYISSYQIFNYALSPDDIFYWYHALNNQGSSKPKMLSIGGSPISGTDQHGINYDSDYNYVSKYNKNLQHISASDSIKMNIQSQLNKTDGSTILYKKDNTLRIGASTDAMNPNISLEVKNKLHISKDVVFSGNNYIMHYLNTNRQLIYGFSDDIVSFNSISVGTITESSKTNGQWTMLPGNLYNSGIVDAVMNANTGIWNMLTNNQIEGVNTLATRPEILYLHQHDLNAKDYSIESKFKLNTGSVMGITIGVNPITNEAIVMTMNIAENRVRIEKCSNDSTQFSYDSNGLILAEQTLDSIIASTLYTCKIVVTNNIIKVYFYQDNTVPSTTPRLTAINSYGNILNQQNVGIFAYGHVSLIYTEFKVYNNNELDIVSGKGKISISNNNIFSDANLVFANKLHIDGDLHIRTHIDTGGFIKITNTNNVYTIGENTTMTGTTTDQTVIQVINTHVTNPIATFKKGSDEKVRFSKTGVGIGTTNGQGDTLNVIDGNDACYGIYPIGAIIMFGASKSGAANTYDDIPRGWLLCDGATFDKTKYDMLSDIIGTNYNETATTTANTHFNVPNLSQRIPHGSSSTTSMAFSTDENVSATDTKQGGNAVLDNDQLASHTHTVSFALPDPITRDLEWSNVLDIPSAFKTSPSPGDYIHASGSKNSPFSGTPLHSRVFQNNVFNSQGSTDTVAKSLENVSNSNNSGVNYKYNYTHNGTSNNVPTVTTASNGGSDPWYPKHTLVRFIIYSGVHQTVTYPWTN